MLLLRDRLAFALSRQPGRTQADLARACGISTASVSNWFTGETKSLRADTLRKAAAFLRCSRDWLETGHGLPGWLDVVQEQSAAYLAMPGNERLSQGSATILSTDSKVPVIGTLSQGADNMMQLRAATDGRPIGYVEAHIATPNAYGLQVFGDELYPAVRHGQVLVIEPGAPCVEGELMLVEMADGYYLICELVTQRDDAVTYTPAAGGPRRTLALEKIAAMHPVCALVPGSRLHASAAA